MRMIDVEKLKIQEIYDEDLKAYGVVYEEDIEERPEVKAIPIEWIEEWGWKNGMSESMSLRVMIDDWEKENEEGKDNLS